MQLLRQQIPKNAGRQSSHQCKKVDRHVLQWICALRCLLKFDEIDPRTFPFPGFWGKLESNFLSATRRFYPLLETINLNGVLTDSQTLATEQSTTTTDKGWQKLFWSSDKESFLLWLLLTHTSDNNNSDKGWQKVFWSCYKESHLLWSLLARTSDNYNSCLWRSNCCRMFNFEFELMISLRL